MKKLLIVTILSAFSVSEIVAKPNNNSELKVCQSYIKQATDYQKTMGDDKISQNTLAFYKEKMIVHCGSIVSKTKFEKKSFSELMMKSDIKTKEECKMAIEMAGKYSETPIQSEMIIAAHKENIVDNCGTLVASYVSSYCLFGEE